MIDVLKAADVIVITAGAGMGVDSGLPDFRGNEGMWKAYPALGNKKIDFMNIANPKAFKKFPKLAWAFYGHRYDLYKNTQPHAGYGAILELAKQKKDYFVVTSNVDGAFQKAGVPDDKLYEIHGRINTFQCTECNNVWKPSDSLKFNVNPKTLKFNDELPKCSCGAVARPNIMMFNDFGFNYAETSKQEKEFNKFMNKYDKNGTKIVVVEFGAGTSIPSIRNIGEFIHEEIKDATLVRVNPREAYGPEGIVSIEKGAMAAVAEDLVSDEIKEMFFID
jgi:NAD-dependent SIR2 family protein deacetylase